jgi:hypothetical protein
LLSSVMPLTNSCEGFVINKLSPHDVASRVTLLPNN